MIRKISENDAASVAHLAASLGYPAEVEAMVCRIKNIVADNEHFLVGYFSDDALLGLVHASSTKSLLADPTLLIHAMAVNQTVRGRGIGRVLVESTEAWAQNQGLGAVTVRSQTKREGAAGFYEHLGFTQQKAQNKFHKRLSL